MSTAKSRDEQTPPGFFMFADAYLESARALRANIPRVPHRDAPVAFLYYQAIELYLKAFLRLHKITTAALASRALGHKLGALGKRAEALGLPLKALDKLRLEFIEDTDAIENSRYIRVGMQQTLTHDRLDQLCRRLRQPIGEALMKDGWPVPPLHPYAKVGRRLPTSATVPRPLRANRTAPRSSRPPDRG